MPLDGVVYVSRSMQPPKIFVMQLQLLHAGCVRSLSTPQACREAIVACRLIPLNKNPGVRPISVCECLRRLVAKAVLSITGPYVREVTGVLQLCAGQDAGIEAAIHAMRDIFIDDETEAILLIDARNAFNNLNRQAALFIVNKLYPAIGKILINTYRLAADLHVAGETIKSLEGTTQGDPLAMAIYAVATMPLLRKVQTPSAKTSVVC